jgi:glucosamine-6-phosphate deaminase
MTSDARLKLLSLPLEHLRQAAQTPFELLADTPALLTHFAASIGSEIRDRNSRGEPTRLILPVGPVRHYAELAEMTNRERLSWKDVWIFQMDEFLDWQGRTIAVDHPLSFEGCLRRELLHKIDPDLRPPEEQYWVPNPYRIDEISEQIARVGGVDVCYGGVGYHGHVAFNEPPLSRWHEISVEELRRSLTRIVMLGDDSIVVQSIHCSGGDSGAIPPMAVTLGMRDILAAGKIRLYLAAGERHRAIFRISVAGEVSVRYPATLVQGHPDALILTDHATARPIEPSLI